MKAGIVEYLNVSDFINKMSGEGYTEGMLRAIYDDLFRLSEDMEEVIEFNLIDISSIYMISDMVKAGNEEEYDRLKEDDNYILLSELTLRDDNFDYFIDKRDLTKYYRIVYTEGDKVLWVEC